MKKHLAGFGIIMAIGLLIALVGSNPASPLVASLLTAVTDSTTQSTSQPGIGTTDSTTSKTETTTATTSDATAESATTTAATTTDTTTTQATTTTSGGIPASSVIPRPSISGIQNGEVVTGIRKAAVQVPNNPMNVRAEFILPSGVIRPIYPQVSTEPTSLLAGATPVRNYYFSIDTTSVPNGPGYKVRGFAKYSDGSLVSSDIVTFAIENTVQEKDFVFVSPDPYVTVSGNVQIQGRSLVATSVAYLIFSEQDSVNPVRTGGTEHIGDLWLHRWDTRTVPNGRYFVQPHVTSRYGLTYKGNALGLLVKNEQTATDPAPQVVQPTSTPAEPVTEPVTTAEQPVAAPEVKVEPAVEPVQSESVVVAEPIQQTAPVTTAEPMRVLAPEAAPVEKQQPATESNTGFFRSVREIFRSVIPREEPVRPQIPVAVVVTSETVQRLERVANELQAAAPQGGGEVSQSVVNRVAKDTDADGIPDYQEIEALRTNPNKKDTDGDGIDDGVEVREGSNPLNADRTIKVQYENAKLLGETVKPELLKIETVALATTTETVVVEVATTTPSGEVRTIKESKKVVKEKIKFTGKTLPHALVTIYVYSDIPTIVTVKADKNGSWSYALDKPLDDGDHQAYVTINDSTGKIVAKSQALGFVKTAQAVTVANFEGLAQAAESEGAEAVDQSKRNFGIIVTLVIGLGLLVGILMVVRSFRNPSNDIV